MSAIWRYPIKPSLNYGQLMPVNAQLLSAHAQDNECCVWALIDEQQPATEMRIFAVYSTGDRLPNNGANLKYIGTCVLYHGKHALHVFEVLSK